MGTSPLSVPRVHGHVATSLPALVSRGAVALFALGFILFQKKLLPRPLARAAARVYFWPTIPFTMARLRAQWPHEYWTEVDATVLVGGAPLPGVGHVRALRALGVRGVVNLCDEYPGPTRAYGGGSDRAKRGAPSLPAIEQLYLPTVDHYEAQDYRSRANIKILAPRRWKR